MTVTEVKVWYGIEIPLSDILASTCANSDASFFHFLSAEPDESVEISISRS